MTRADLSSPRSMRLGVALAVAALHVALVLALVRAFAPGLTAQVAEKVVAAFTVTVTTPPPPPPPAAPAPSPKVPDRDGLAGETGKRALPRPLAAPSPRVVLATQAAAPVPGTGRDFSAGARDAGAGSGAGGSGPGSGAGSGGSGPGGGGAATKPVKIAGDINSARDYPAATRQQRLGDHVVLALTVGTDGRVTACRVHRPSRDPQSDQITCRLASERFRFRPAADAAGNPVEAVFGWQQRWFDPKQK